MNHLPDFTSYGYQVIRELGQNYQGGRITYLAKNTTTQQQVVIKQFLFATFSAEWAGFKAYEREIKMLRSLNHPGIPHYLDSFETSTGFCMVQEYKNAEPLSQTRSFEADEIKKIAVKTLEILLYLQNRIPPVIHRDIKPENLLVDEQLDVYLVDFGFARIGGGEVVAMSSMVAGTTGFMPPEQLLNRPLTEASDLYGLGLTLICLLTGIKSIEITHLIDNNFRINFKHLVPQLSFRFIEWLEKMVQPNYTDRYPNAGAALEALKPLYVIRLPKVKISQDRLDFTATRLGEKLTKIITVSNSIPETVLEGRWKIVPHLNDPPLPSQAWIFLNPKKFSSNSAKCKILVNTAQLMAGKSYERQIRLHTNSSPKTQTIMIKVRTAPLPIQTGKIPYVFLTLLLVTSGVVGAAEAAGAAGVAFGAVAAFAAVVGAGVVVGAAIGAARWVAPVAAVGAAIGAAVGAMIGFSAGLLPGAAVGLLGGAAVGLLAGAALGLLAGAGVGAVVGAFTFTETTTKALGQYFVKRGLSAGFTAVLLLLTVGLGLSLGIGFKGGFSHQFIRLALAGTGLPLVAMILYPPLNRARLIAEYRQSEQNRIKP